MEQVLHKTARHAVQPKATEKRLYYIDNLRWLMIVLVVMMHLNVTYSSMGLWYYQETKPPDFLSFMIFGMYGSLVQAFFMGLLFFIAGYFVPGSYDKKGFSRFVRDRLIRLGIPTLVFMLIINPMTELISSGQNAPQDILQSYAGYITSLDFLEGSGPLWFALALLIFSVAYALVRLLKLKFPGNRLALTHSRVVMLISIISFFAFFLRIVQPSGPNAVTFLNMQLGNFSQYIVLFIMGIISYRSNLLAELPYKFGMFWLRLALFIGIPAWLVLMLSGGDLPLFFGGLHWQSLAYAVWESFFCVGVCLGLLVIFREKYNISGKVSRFLSENAFGVYVFHPPVLVLITMMFSWLAMYPLLKMILMAAMVIPACFGFSYLVRRIPVMRMLFS